MTQNGVTFFFATIVIFEVYKKITLQTNGVVFTLLYSIYLLSKVHRGYVLNQQKVLAEREQLEAQIKSIGLELKRLPRKHIYCTRNGKFYKWYESNGKTSKYIPKKKREYAEKLARKKYLTYLREELQQEKKAIDKYLSHHNLIGKKSEQLLEVGQPYAELLAPYFRPQSIESNEWMYSPYERNEFHLEKLIYDTSIGIKVRSKSEMLIVMCLHAKKIPFRYECLLRLGDASFYPDFTIKHPVTGEIYYWEHFGMMDLPDYVRNAFAKLKLYADYNIVPGSNLITTFETQTHPLDAEMINMMIEYYFS